VVLPATAAITGLQVVAGTLAALRLGPVDLVEPATGLSAALAGRRLGVALVLGMLPVVALALVAGPVLCSWVCPWGLISEGLDALRRHARHRLWPEGSWIRVRRLRWIALAGVLGLSAVVGVPLAALLSAPRLATALPLEALYLRLVSPVTAGLLLALLVLELAGPRRLWCRALCPVGALANYLRTPRTLTVGVDPSACRCPRLALCHAGCRWGVDPRRMGRFDGCTSCFACVDGCPSGALAVTTRRPATGVPADRLRPAA
jgi:ferredoxin-type protein NapH